MFSKRLEKGKFVWPSAKDGKISATPAQLSMLLEGIVLMHTKTCDCCKGNDCTVIVPGNID